MFKAEKGILLATLVLNCLVSLSQAAIVATGDVSPSDPSTWTLGTSCYIGNTTIGSLSVDAGIALQTSYSYLGFVAGSNGTVTVTGPGSSWDTNAFLYVGNAGNGALFVEAGGKVSSSWCFIGDQSGSTGSVTVSGSGSQWINSNNIYVGYNGSGQLTVADGGQVSARTLYASLNDLLGNGTITARARYSMPILSTIAATGSSPWSLIKIARS